MTMNQTNLDKAALLKLKRKAQLDPSWWAKQCGWNMWDLQNHMLNALAGKEPERRVAVPAAFGIGKTYLAARAALWFLYTHRPSRVITTAPTRRQVQDLLWAELRTAHATSRRRLGGSPLKLKLELAPGWDAVGFSTDAGKIDQFTGYHAPSVLVIFDQAAGIEPGTWEGAEGFMTSDYVRWLAISNATDSASVMAQVSTGKRTKYGTWDVHKITAHDSPNVKAGCNVIPGIISHDWVNRKREVWDPTDPMWQIFVEANFVEEAMMTFLTGAMIRMMFEEELAPNWGDIEIGVDVADEGVDSTVWTVRAGPRLLFIDQVYGNDPMQVANKTEEIYNRIPDLTGGYSANLITVDKIGIGSGVVARLGEKNLPVQGVNVGVRALTDQEQFLNHRAELGWSIRTLAEHKAICLRPLYPTPDRYIDTLREEMTVRYKFLGSNKIQMERKDDIRKRLQRSPDFWDSMMLCFGGTSDIPRVTLAADPVEHIVKPANEGILTMDEMLTLHGMHHSESDYVQIDTYDEYDESGDAEDQLVAMSLTH